MSVDSRWQRATAGVGWLDIAIAGLVAVSGQLEVWATASGFAHRVGPRPVLAVVYLVTSVALLWRRRAPMTVVAAVTGALALLFVTFGASEGLGSFLPFLFALFAAGRYGSGANSGSRRR